MSPVSRPPSLVDLAAGARDRLGARRQRRAAYEATELRQPLGAMDGRPAGSPATAVDERPAVEDAPVRSVATARPTPAPGPSAGGAPGTVLSIEQVGPMVRILRIARPSDFSYAAGQHLKLGAAGSRRGTYSIASAPHESHVEVCIKLVPDGRLTPALFEVRPGDQLVTDWRAKGSFKLDERARTHLMVATAAGISPLRSLLRDARRRGVTGPVIVLHGASHPDELPYLDELTAQAASDPNLRYEATVSRPAAPRSKPWTGRTGRVDALAARVLATLDPGNTRVYACGNAGMIKTVVAHASDAGFPVSTESFG